ncbi:hypothetical protein [Streptomyces caniscabiei]|uniref:Secreted protein n=1 Tax=Streptomyces caniscabiei TaxID=2746961 RepID=A0ABU4MIK7_9ACTN|nr:hypothetical protein [Streptomyces caniscabiei]MBE4791034.1 hypothetical protein [Streptomyces caniscabiei]MDX3009663.1 hypothetical protein [Streptomyces caniscabiei]MDX3037308.1 hypothetical protein [Streptomyces caniscabiei]
MDAAIVGPVLVLVGVLSGSIVAYLGKRAENATTRINSEMDQIQEERNKYLSQVDGLQTKVGEKDRRIEELLEQRLADRETITRLRIKIMELGGDPS